ncbi:MAG: hypothetical protein AAF845_17310 [Bacteroidota bacterium]
MRLAVFLFALAAAAPEAQPVGATLTPAVGAAVPVAGGVGDPWAVQPGLRLRKMK